MPCPHRNESRIFRRMAVRAGPVPVQETRAAKEHKKGGLEDILGIIRVMQYARTHSEHHGAVPLHQDRECGFLMTAEKPLQQLPIGKACKFLRTHQPVKVPDDVSQLPACHLPISPEM